MNGAESLLTTARDLGLTTCFANPGTTEMPLVRALDEVSGVRPVLCLSEGVVTGAADGYARMSQDAAMTLLHLGPGLANGIANLHNARRARSPVVNVIGEHASWHQHADPPLASDIESLARPVCDWVDRTRESDSVAADLANAAHAARNEHTPATLIAAADHLWEPAASEEPAIPETAGSTAEPSAEHSAEVAATLTRAPRPALLLGDTALSAPGLRLASQVAAATGARLFTERTPARLERGPNLPIVPALPYFPEDILHTLEDVSDLVLVGADCPVSFFGYPGSPSHPVPPHTTVHTLAGPEHDAVSALRELTEHTGTAEPAPVNAPEPVTPSAALDPRGVAAAIVSTQPSGSVIVNEGVSGSGAYAAAAAAAPAHTELTLTGGAIGLGIPMATGAAVAAPERPVIGLQADGSGLYTVQGLWTQARLGLNVTTVVLANRRYRILDAELRRAGVTEAGPATSDLTALSGPTVDWVSVSEGFGVSATRVRTGEELVGTLREVHAEPGPHLIEAVLG